MSDRRLRQLERALFENPHDLQLQHATFTETLRVGLLPSAAWDNYTPLLESGRPVQPWQWVPASYVLLEAEREGRHTEWRAGKVEIEWARPGPVPAWGLEAESLLQAIEGRVGWAWQLQQSVGDVRYFPQDKVTKVFVGAVPADYTTTRIVAGVDPAANPIAGVYRNAPLPEEILAVFPSRHVPGLNDREAIKAKLRGLDGSWQGYHHTRMPEPGYEAETQKTVYDGGEIPPPYTGSFPDVYDPQMLLRGFSRVRTSGPRGSRRRDPGKGPLLDVRLIKRVRIMRRKKRGGWS
jgi:hypothetical protein